MDGFLDLVGSSGNSYRYLASAGRISPMGGNFVLVRELADGAWELVRAGETESLLVGLEPVLAEAKSDHGSALRLYTRLNISGATRRLERDDIMAAYHPAQRVSEDA